MGKSVRQLLSEISSAELTEWMAFERLEPFGEMVSQYQRGMQLALKYNSIPRKKRVPTARAENFVLGNCDYITGGPKKQKQSAEDIKSLLMPMVKSKKKRGKK